MKRYICIAVALASFSFNTASAQDNANGVFLTLTRKPEKLAALPVNITSVTSEQLENDKPLDVGEALYDLPGININRIGSAGSNISIMVRGASSDQVLVLIDGRRANDPASGEASLSMIPTSQIDRIEIIRGGASAIYGTGASGGVINIITKTPAENRPSIELNANTGSYASSAYDISMRAADGPLSVFVTAGKSASDGWRQNSDYDRNNFFGSFSYDAHNTGKFSLTASFVNDRLGAPGTGPLVEQYDGKKELVADTPFARQSDSNADWKLEHVKSWNDYSLKSCVYASDKDNTLNNPPKPMYQDNSSFVFGSEIQLSNNRGSMLGGEWYEESYKQKDLIAGITAVEKDKITTAVYVQQELKTGKFNFIPSLRYDQNSVFDGVACPHLSIVYTPNDVLKLSANSGKVWRAPTFNDLYYPLDPWGEVGNPKLVPEQGIASDAGAELKFTNADIKLNIFNIDMENLIMWQPIPGTTGWTPTNLGKSVQAGAEFEFGQKLISGLYHKLNYTYLWAQNTSALNSGDPNAQQLLIYRPRNMLNYGINYTALWDMDFGVEAQYVSERTTGQTPALLPEYRVYNFMVSKKIKDLKLWARVDNFTNERYQTRVAYPLPGTTWTTGISVKFWN
jgi:outer membrane cobalamin receptor